MKGARRAAITAVFPTGHQRMVSGDENHAAFSHRTNLFAQRGRHRACIRWAFRLSVANDEAVKPPLRVEENELQSPGVQRDRTRAAITWEHAYVATAGEGGDHLLLKADRVEPERAHAR